jgi:Fe-S-cluster-containing dehydrogenase component
MSSIKENKKEFESTFFSEPKTRRNVLKSIGSGMTIAALSGCVNIRKPKQTIRAYNKEPDNLIPGKPNYYSTSFELNGDVNGILGTTFEGRPTKLDGHPDHPNNYGKSNAFIQAEIQQLYDPDRLKNHYKNNKTISQKDIDSIIKKAKKDNTFAIITSSTLSLINQRLLSEIKKKYPKVKLYCLDRVNSDKELKTIKSCTGSFGYLIPNYKKTKLIVSFNHDILGVPSHSLSKTKEFIDNKNNMKFISYTNSLTLTDSKADHVFTSSLIEQEQTLIYIANKLANKFSLNNITNKIPDLKFNTTLFDVDKANKVLKQLQKYYGKTIVYIGEQHTENTHKIVMLINQLLNNFNRTLFIRSFPYRNYNNYEAFTLEDSIKDLKHQLLNDKIKTIVSIGVNLIKISDEFEDLIKNKTIIYQTKYKDSLSKQSQYTIADSHFLENWDMYISKEGHLSIQQPLIKPLYSTTSLTKTLCVILNKNITPYTYISRLCKNLNINFKNLKKTGLIKNYRSSSPLFIKKININKTSNKTSNKTLSIIPSYTLFDGKYSNSAWLQETPDPISKLTWGNALYINSYLAKDIQAKTGTIVKITLNNGAFIKGPVIILPGQEKTTLTLTAGYGNYFDTTFSNEGIATDGLNINTNYGIEKIERLNETAQLATTQMNHGLDEESLAASGIKQRINSILKVMTVEELNKPNSTHTKAHKAHSLFKEQEYTGEYQWGMSIDLNACIGCNTCSVACQSENNIPIVGKQEVLRGREMSWIRMDRYFTESNDNDISIHYMPMACVHCENAPCEQVCPVNATVHDDEGLNVMTYNRCIGTRYCANNCPYKVRRFNFFDWHQKNPQSVEKDRIHLFDYFREPAKQTQKQFNPEVTVRMRGVMEKCTYCTQRISQAKIESKTTHSDAPIQNLQTACQQACPTHAIIFGNIEDKTSLIAKKRKSKRRTDLLDYELNTQPRTIHLAKIINPIWENKKQELDHGHH